ncbi:MAG: hypothetical protein OEZ47_16515 [Gammaproteobacteria bacterium]|nr:hypothetical protein [Gammaproteobacteria bacterium]
MAWNSKLLLNFSLIFCVLTAFSVHGAENRIVLEGITIQPPVGEAWKVIYRGSDIMRWEKAGPWEGERYSAQVLVFAMGPVSKNEFISKMKEFVQKDFPSPGMVLKDLEFRDNADRQYPCLSFNSLEKEKLKKNSDPMKPRFLLGEYLYCLHPKKEMTGFAAIYMFDGENPGAGFKATAKRFIDGIQAFP